MAAIISDSVLAVRVVYVEAVAKHDDINYNYDEGKPDKPTPLYCLDVLAGGDYLRAEYGGDQAARDDMFNRIAAAM